MGLIAFPFSHQLFESGPALAAWAGVASYPPSHYLPFALIVSLNCRLVLAPGQSLEQANLESLSQGRGVAGARTLRRSKAEEGTGVRQTCL